MIDPTEFSLSQHLAEEDERSRQLDEFQELIQPKLDEIEDMLSYILNVAESFPQIDLDDEIKNSISELL